jgi:ABC-2 type transport system ATP-binding protein
MEEVERLCQEVAIIDQGKIVASGGLSELKQTSQRMKEVTIHFTEEPPDLGLEDLPGVISANRNCSTVTVDLEDLDESLTRVLSQCKTRGASVKSIQSHIPSLEHIFLEVTGRSLRD